MSLGLDFSSFYLLYALAFSFFFFYSSAVDKLIPRLRSVVGRPAREPTPMPPQLPGEPGGGSGRTSALTENQQLATPYVRLRAGARH